MDSVLDGDLGRTRQGSGDPRFTRTFRYAGTQQGLTEAEHANRERLRLGTVAFEKRVYAAVAEASGQRREERWAQLERVDLGQAKEMLDRSNALFHGTEDTQFVHEWRS